MLLAGFGGQGIMMVGQLLSIAADNIGKKSTFYPSYGPEQRGGTANCSVVISDEEVGSPVVNKPDVLVCFNQAALAKFIDSLKPGGALILNASLAHPKSVMRKDIEILAVDADNLAESLGSAKVSNIILLGAIARKTGIVTLKELQDTVAKKLAKRPELLELNKRAVQCGMEQAEK
jgi:2-oxoglutarate ferredoxin oxidoreductase subunit gamma